MMYMEKVYGSREEALNRWKVGWFQLSLDGTILPRHLYPVAKCIEFSAWTNRNRVWYFKGLVRAFRSRQPLRDDASDVGGASVEGRVKDLLGVRIEWNDENEKAWEDLKADILVDPLVEPSEEEYEKFRMAVLMLVGSKQAQWAPPRKRTTKRTTRTS
eukprot:GFYU01012785.1.p1 GENE.GFYU01012785.1~~GFYU01012785.1.p1  ORF type:complete len:178 (+),score=17.87 GFYU01012785.1:62-535(+)